ncbi:MAG: hypothetical protein IPK19_02150 [Chloroflexi bacterium]|nr:hypothetical protein [Chloroflexota bacterium]
MSVLRARFQRLMLRGSATTFLLALLGVSVALAQTTDCPAFVDQAIEAASATCGAMGRNTVCYGNNAIEAEFANATTFAKPGDMASVIDLQRLATAPLIPEDQIWGVAVLALQADLPDVAIGQNVTFIVFGDAQVTPESPEEAGEAYPAPMQAFRLDTRLTGINCQDVPESGMLVQAPEATTVNFRINGVEVKVGSTAMLQVEGEELEVSTIEGFVEVTSAGVSEVAGEGTTLRVARGRRPLRAALTRAARVARAPWRLLPRRVAAMPPPPDGQVVTLNECFFQSAQRAARNPVQVRAGETVVLRFNIPVAALPMARIYMQQTRSTIRVNGEVVPVYTRVGPWRGGDGEFGESFGMEFYWLIESPPQGLLRIQRDTVSTSGNPIPTLIDGPDPDRQPEVIPARSRAFCAVQVGPA